MVRPILGLAAAALLASACAMSAQVPTDGLAPAGTATPTQSSAEPTGHPTNWPGINPGGLLVALSF